MKAFAPAADLAIAPPAVGIRGMVATSQPLATRAGLDVLRAGGTAIDAAIAANAVLSVTEPHMCGPGGDLFALLWDPGSGALHGLNASGPASQSLSLEALQQRLGSRRTIPARGPLSLTLPGAVSGWSVLHQRFGKLPWARLFEAAEAAACDGFPLAPRSALWWERGAAELVADRDSAPHLEAFAATFLPQGAAPHAGSVQRNPALARFYALLAREGSRCVVEGEVAAALINACHRAGAALEREELERYAPVWESSVCSRYRGQDVHVLPPNGQGICLLQILSMLETFDPEPRESVAWWHRYLEAKKLAFADRAASYADPRHAAVPIEELLSPEYARRRAACIHPERAGVDPTPPGVQVPGSDTTLVCVADAEGRMVSLIQSLFVPFGSGLVVPEFGFALQSRASGFALDPRHPNAWAPGKRPFHTLMPALVMGRDGPLMVLGAIGGDMQPQAQAQILARLLEFGCDVQRAGALPRLRHVGGATPQGQGAAQPEALYHDAGFDETILTGLMARGHHPAPAADPVTGFTGGYQGIMRHPDTGVWWGGSDHRLDGCALGF